MNKLIVGKNVEKLILKRNVTLEQLSKEMQIDKNELAKKIEGKQEFCVSDVLSITKVFELSNEEVGHIFFNLKK